jgi:5-(carboxyamino)imidazole ribonucleotide synthase
VLDALDVVGVTCIEFFLTPGDALLINEIAPRPHNSGHLTIEAAATSQFEQHIRAVCGLPLGSTRQRQPAAMANLLGDLWSEEVPDWPAALSYPDVKLHLYGKHEARAGRKMGHLTAVAVGPAAGAANGANQAVDRVLAARNALTRARGGDGAGDPRVITVEHPLDSGSGRPLRTD